MDLGINGRWALVCGASKGLGLGCARALVREGVNVGLRVTLSALHTPEQVRGLVEAIASARDRVTLAVGEAAPPPLPAFA